MQLPVVMAVQVRGEHLFCLERPAGAEQFVLTRRSAVDPDAEPLRARRPGRRHGRRGQRHRLVRGVAGRRARRRRHERGRHRGLRAARARRPATAATSARRSPTPGPAAWPGSPTARASSTPATRRATSTTARCTTTASATAGRTIRSCGPSTPTRRRGRTSTMSPDGAWLLVHVRVGWARVDVHLLDRSTGTWTTVVEGVEATTELVFAADGDSLVGVTTLDAPRGRVVRVPLERPGDVGDARRRGRRRALGVPGGRRRAAGGGHDAGRRRRAPLRRGRPLASARSTGSATSIAVAGLDADRVDRLGVRRRRLVRRADVAVARRAGDEPAARWSTPAAGAAPCRRSSSATSATRRSTARASGCS